MLDLAPVDDGEYARRLLQVVATEQSDIQYHMPREAGRWRMGGMGGMDAHRR